MITRGTKHEYAARTLCAVIIGKRSPKTTMMGDSIPVIDEGKTTWSGTSTLSPSRLLYQCTRNKLRGSAAFLSTPAVRLAGMRCGSASSPNVGRTIFCSAKRRTLFSSDFASTILSASPNCSWRAVASRVDSRAAEAVTPIVCHPKHPVPDCDRYPQGVAGVAQLAEAAGLGPACWGFESLHRHCAYL